MRITELDDKNFGTYILAIANVVRKSVLLGNKKIAEAIDKGPYSECELSTLIDFVDLFMRGYEKEQIIKSLQISPELVEKLDKHQLAW